MKLTQISIGISIALIFAACNTNKSEEFKSSSADLTDVTSDLTADLPDTAAKLVKTADLDFKVADVYKSSSNIQQNVKRFGGLVMHNDIQTQQLDSKTIPLSGDSLQVISSYSVEARMTVRVPSETLTDFVASIASDAVIIYTAKVDIEDRSIDYLGTSLKQRDRQKILNRQLGKDSLKTDDMLRLANEQEAVTDRRMDNLRTNASVRYSTIVLHFTQNNLLKKEAIPNDDLNSYRLPVYKRVAEALSSGLEMFIAILIGILYMWPFIFAGFGIWMIYRFLQHRLKSYKSSSSEEQRLL